MTLNFSDGVSLDTSGPYRLARLQDGLYVIGNGCCIPVDSYEEAHAMLADLRAAQARKMEVQ